MNILRLIPLLLFTLQIQSATAINRQDDGIKFFEGTWSALLEKAQKEQKLIFIDVYTTWCPPCKQMDKDVIPLPEVGKKYNALFINYKLDAEKGEGAAIAKQYNVNAYPTYLYLNARGELLHRAVGFNEAGSFIAQADKASLLGDNKSAIGMLEKDFKEGNRQPEFLRAYIEKLTGLGLDNTEALNAYFSAMPVRQLATSTELTFLGEHMSSAKANALVFLIAHYKTFSPEERKKLAPRLYKGVLYSAAVAAWKEGRPAELQQLLAYMDMLEPDFTAIQKAGVNRMRLLYYGMVKDVAQLKVTGHNMIGNLMEIPLDTIRAEDARRYQQLMAPYLRGELDSTKVVGFQEEKPFLVNVYSREISGKLFEVATAFVASLDADDAALKDALAWARRAKMIVPSSQPIAALVEKLEKMAERK